MKQLIKKAKEKGFESELLKVIDDYECKAGQYNPDLKKDYLVLCELQKWLRDKMNVYVYVENSSVGS